MIRLLWIPLQLAYESPLRRMIANRWLMHLSVIAVRLPRMRQKLKKRSYDTRNDEGMVANTVCACWPFFNLPTVCVCDKCDRLRSPWQLESCEVGCWGGKSLSFPLQQCLKPFCPFASVGWDSSSIRITLESHFSPNIEYPGTCAKPLWYLIKMIQVRETNVVSRRVLEEPNAQPSGLSSKIVFIS